RRNTRCRRVGKIATQSSLRRLRKLVCARLCPRVNGWQAILPTLRGRERTHHMKPFALSAFALALLALLPASASAESYPSRTVSVVVPFPAGGSVDGVARILVQKLNESVGQHFIVENRPGGASGTVGANAVAKAPPDGYTLLLSASVHVINPFLYKSVP